MLLEPSSSSDEDWDEQGGQPQLQQFTIGLISDCPTVTVPPGNCFKVLIDSGATISLMCTSVYNMIEDHYKTCILPAALNLWTAEGSLLSFMGKQLFISG